MEDFKKACEIFRWTKRHVVQIAFAFLIAAQALTMSCATIPSHRDYTDASIYVDKKYQDEEIFSSPFLKIKARHSNGSRVRLPHIGYSVGSGRTDASGYYYPGNSNNIVRDPFRLKK